MTKIFRLYKDGDDTIQNWGGLNSKYDTTQINTILDPEGGSSKYEVTSIPSPFARIDLCKTAFAEVNKLGLKGEKAYHKIVAHCLDVAELFFNYQKLEQEGKLSIIVWDKRLHLNELENSNKEMYNTLNMYLKQDSETYNFDKMDKLFLLNYIGPDKPHKMNIIGATSPATMFFSNANDLSYVTKNIDFGTHRPFQSIGNFIEGSNIYVPLKDRDEAFINFIFAFREAHKDFSDCFPELYEYLDNTYSELSNEQKEKVDNAQLESFDLCSIENDIVTVLNHKIYCKSAKFDFDSDFEIVSTKKQRNKLPLVLPVSKGNKYSSNKYVDTGLGNVVAPVNDPELIDKRRLPSIGNLYPYLTMNDFLEETILQCQYNLTDDFSSGICNLSEKVSVLLPIKELYFNYFTLEDLKNNISVVLNRTGCITVKLTIPIKGKNPIEYTRTYYLTTPIDPKDGLINYLDEEFYLTLFPKVRFNNNNQAFYRVGSRNSKDIKLTPVSEQNGELQYTPIIRKASNYFDNLFSVDQNNIDYFKITCEGVNGVLPLNLTKQEVTNNIFKFAIDLGTSNTHIEYSVNDKYEKAFDISKDDIQKAVLSDHADFNIQKLRFDTYLMPDSVGMEDSEVSLPIRTILAVHPSANWNKSIEAFGHVSIPYYYGKRQLFGEQLISDLKWSTESVGREHLKKYIECLMIQLRNKVILNGGQLEETEIVWFYPISMSLNKIELLRELWNNLYSKYFGSEFDKKVSSVTESLAPYHFFQQKNPDVNNIVTIDIGGGTSDIVAVNNEKFELISSFRFAANTLLGDGYTKNTMNNGMIKHFIPIFKNILTQNERTDTLKIFDGIIDTKNSSDIASFLFNLSNDVAIKKLKIEDKVDFQKMLSTSGEYKIGFVYFYAAIIYYVACLMKAKNLSSPRHIAFSGNGSRIINVISIQPKVLEKFTHFIFEYVYGDLFSNQKIGILLDKEHPKEATCKGGMRLNDETLNIETLDLKSVLIDKKTVVDKENHYKYKDLIQASIEPTLDMVDDFILMLSNINKQFSYKDNFGVEPKSMRIINENLRNDLDTFYLKGLKELVDVEDSDDVNESPFFYPIKGIINRMLNDITKAIDEKD